jgi:hypothetical protein
VIFLGLFQIILLFMKLILLLVNFRRTIRTEYVYFYCLCLILLFVVSLGEWVLWYWSFMGMIGYFGTGPIWACVKVADYCDASSTGTLTLNR